jgi:hypothetical protein
VLCSSQCYVHVAVLAVIVGKCIIFQGYGLGRTSSMMSTIAFRHTSISIGSHYMHSCYCAIKFCLVKVIMLMVQGPFLTCFICDSGPGLGAQYLVYLLCCVLVDHTPYALKGFTRLCAKLFLMGFSPLSVYS